MCTCTVCVIPRRLYEAWQVIDAARKLVKHNGCLAAGAHALGSAPPCECTYCELKAALKEFNSMSPSAEFAQEHQQAPVPPAEPEPHGRRRRR